MLPRRIRGLGVERHQGYDNPWRGLALAIIAQAVQDVRLNSDTYPGRAMRALHFLRSPWADELALACDLQGPSWRALLRELEECVRESTL